MFAKRRCIPETKRTSSPNCFDFGRMLFMGGLGSGGGARWLGHVSRTLVEDCATLDSQRDLASFLTRYSPCDPMRENGTVTIKSKHSDTMLQTIQYQSRKFPSGGMRWFFMCPICGHLARKLFLKNSGSKFGCRACLGLAYWSSRKTRKPNQFVRMMNDFNDNTTTKTKRKTKK